MRLYRPTGIRELRLVLDADLRAWPPRLPDQPIFYPVLNEGYAEQIAREWNTNGELHVGYATEFEIDDAYAARFERRVVGGRQHEELWVPAEELEEFNGHLMGPIRVVSSFFRDDFVGLAAASGPLAGLTAREQLSALESVCLSTPDELNNQVIQNRAFVFLHLPYWHALAQTRGKSESTSETLTALETTWTSVFPHLPLSRARGLIVPAKAG